MQLVLTQTTNVFFLIKPRVHPLAVKSFFFQIKKRASKTVSSPVNPALHSVAYFVISHQKGLKYKSAKVEKLMETETVKRRGRLKGF